MKKIPLALLALTLLLFPFPALAGHLHPEKYYQERWCRAVGGSVATVQSKEIDCLTDTHAIEVEFAGFKSYEAVGQALRYMRLSGRDRGGILFVVEKPSDIRFVDETKKDIAAHGLKIDVWTVK